MQSNQQSSQASSPSPLNQRGFTLVEAFISIVIFGIFIASIFQYLSYSLDLSENARDLNRVTQIMQHQMEDLRSTKWDDLPSLEGKTSHSGQSRTESRSILLEPFLLTGKNSHSLRISPCPKPAFTRPSLVASWTDRQGKNYARRFETWLADEGLNAYYTRST